MSEQGIPRLVGWRCQHRLLGLELKSDQSHWLAPAKLCQQKLLLYQWAGFPYHDSLSNQWDRDVLTIAVVKDLVLPVYLTVCLALSSHHLPVPRDTTRRISY